MVKTARLDLAESALHAPQAGWGEVEFYPDFPMKAAVLLVRLAKNHALPDGNKRTALTCMVRFCLRNGHEYLPPLGDHPDGEETFQRMLAHRRRAGRGPGSDRNRDRPMDCPAALPVP